MHDAVQRRDVGPDPDGQGPASARRRHGAVLQRSPAGLPDRDRRRPRLRAARPRRHGGSRRRALRPARDEPPGLGQGPQQPVLRVRPGQVHRLLSLRPGMRRGPGHVRLDDRRSRFRLPRLGRPGPALPRVRMRELRRLRPGLPDRRPPGEDPHPARPAEPKRPDDLCLLRRRVLVHGRAQGRHRREHGPVQGRRGERGPLVRQGSLRVGLRQPSGSRAAPDGPRHDRRAVARGGLGRSHRLHGRPLHRASPPSTARARSAASRRRAAPTKRSTSSRRWSARRSARTTSIPAPVSAIRRPGTASRPTFGTSAGTQDFASVEQGGRHRRHRGQPDRRPSGRSPHG